MGGSGENGREWGEWEGVGRMGSSGENGRKWEQQQEVREVVREVVKEIVKEIVREKVGGGEGITFLHGCVEILRFTTQHYEQTTVSLY